MVSTLKEGFPFERVSLLDLLIVIYGLFSIIYNYLQGSPIAKYAIMTWIAIAIPYFSYRLWLYWPVFKFLHGDSIVDISVHINLQIKIKIKNIRKPYRIIWDQSLEKIIISKIREMLRNRNNKLLVKNFKYDFSKNYEDLVYLRYYNECSEREYSVKLSSNIKLYKDEKDILKTRGEIEIDNVYLNLLIDGSPSGEFLPIEFKCLKHVIKDTFVFVSNFKKSIRESLKEISYNNFIIKLIDVVEIPMIIKFRRLASRKVKKNIEEKIQQKNLRIEQRASVRESLAFIRISDINKISSLELYDMIEDFLKRTFLPRF